MERSLSLLLLLLLLLPPRGGAAERLEALVPGDILIGALFSLHEDVSRDESFSPHVPQCVRPLERGVVRALAMVDAVQRVNAAPLLTDANLTLGLWIQDSCSDVGTALRATEQFTRGETCGGDTAAAADGTTAAATAAAADGTTAAATADGTTAAATATAADGTTAAATATAADGTTAAATATAADGTTAAATTAAADGTTAAAAAADGTTATAADADGTTADADGTTATAADGTAAAADGTTAAAAGTTATAADGTTAAATADGTTAAADGTTAAAATAADGTTAAATTAAADGTTAAAAAAADGTTATAADADGTTADADGTTATAADGTAAAADGTTAAAAGTTATAADGTTAAATADGTTAAADGTTAAADGTTAAAATAADGTTAAATTAAADGTTAAAAAAADGTTATAADADGTTADADGTTATAADGTAAAADGTTAAAAGTTAAATTADGTTAADGTTVAAADGTTADADGTTAAAAALENITTAAAAADGTTAVNATAAETQTGRRRPVMALIGATHSELSISVARQLTLRMIPQISYSSTAAILSDKSRFPAFLRTIPSDEHQTAAMVRLLSAMGWSWVGLVTTDGDYGRSALDLLLSQSSERSICVAFRAVLSAAGERGGGGVTTRSAQIRDAARSIYSSPRVRVVVSFASPALMTQLWAELKTQALAAGDSVDSVRRVWVASDSWSLMSLEDVEDVEGIGHVIGFHFRAGTWRRAGRQGTGEREAAREGEGFSSRPEMKAFYRMLKAEHGEDVERRLTPELHTDTVFSVQMAVMAIAHAAVQMCRHHDCKTPGAVQPWQLLRSLWMEEFEMEGERFSFDRRGDINLGYDVSLWRVRSAAVLRETVLQYHPQNNSFTYEHAGLRNPLHAFRSVVSRCSDSCAPGQFKKSAEGQHTCCYECINCTQNYYSNSTDMDQCLSCDTDREWSPGGSAACVPKRPLFFCWDNGFAIALASLSALGIVLALLMSALFFRRRQTPVVRAAGGPLSQVMLHSLVVSFVSALLFVGRPNDLQCKARQVLFGLSFTVCVACVLVKTLQILLAFQFNPTLQAALRRLYRPYAVVSVCVAVQAATCICWLVLKSPSVHVLNQNTTLLHDCHEGSYLAFGAVLGYIALLALVCFVCAFKCRKLPQQYNEARFITFSMLLYLMAWLLFVPIYVTTSGVYLPAVEMVVILISNYGILSCHFLPKCYVMLFRKDKNTQSAFRKTIYEYASKRKSTLSESSSESSGDAVSSDSSNGGVKSVQVFVLNQDSRQRRSLRRSSSV